MSGLFLRRADARHGSVADAAAQFERRGFPQARMLSVPGWQAFHVGPILGGPANLLVEGDAFAAVAGTITVDGKMGTAALRALLACDLPTIDWDRIGGQFVALVRRRDRTFLFTDYFAAFQLFHDDAMTLFSTSFLTTARSIGPLSFDPQGVYEYAFNNLPIGNDTVFREIRLLGPTTLVEIMRDGIVMHPLVKGLPAAIERMPIDDRMVAHREALDATVAAHVGHFGDHVNCPLSGGLDSRLLLAALRAAGARPNVYVYGPPGSRDVAVAQRIGAAEGFPVEWIDKGAMPPPAPDAFAEAVERSFEELDALPQSGNIFDAGGGDRARVARHVGGALAASGGCGEIYRDFFFLPDRQMTARRVARTFFARYAPGDVTHAFDARAFVDRIAAKISEALGVPHDGRRLPRERIEHIYPAVRCRAFFGREISLENQYGAYFMPFLDQRVVARAMTLPMRLKQAGRFESALLLAIDPTLAGHASVYGHHFAGPPGRRHRFDEWAARIRPEWMRARSYALKRRLGPMSDEEGGVLTPDYMGRVIDLRFPAMSRYFRMAAITDSGLWRRIAALEYLARRLGSVIVS